MHGKGTAEHNGRKNPVDVRVHLEEQNHRFALDRKAPAAGELWISGQNLVFRGNNIKPGSGYKLFFIGRKNGSSVYKVIGDIIAGEDGTAELQCTINPVDMDGEGTELSCFYIFMVAVMGKPVQPVLKGDLNIQQASYRDGGKSKEKSAERRTYNNYYSEYILRKIEMLKATSDRYMHISPFDDVWLADRWKRVTDTELLPVASLGAEQQIKKYGHFIFSSKEEHFYLAVPGKHDEEEWPDKGKSGFLLWQSIRESEEYGYWTMVIDCKTGIITEIP